MLLLIEVKFFFLSRHVTPTVFWVALNLGVYSKIRLGLGFVLRNDNSPV